MRLGTSQNSVPCVFFKQFETAYILVMIVTSSIVFAEVVDVSGATLVLLLLALAYC